MSPDAHEPTERLGRFADDPRGDPADLGLDADEAARIARAVEALEDAVALDEAEVAAALEGLAETDEPIAPPDLPSDYEVLDEIGRGGMGVVYRAHQASLDRTVAVKVLRPGEILFGQAMKRFEREARALARLRHRHIVSIHEVGESDGRVWFSMDLIEGRSMADLLRDGRMLPAKAVRLLKQVASAVAYVHANGLVHRDLKPANILLDADGEAVVTDFGLALEIGGSDDLTLTGQVLGTPAYMSPEQARGDTARIGEATDVYAMGAILYECLAGQRPFAHASPAMQVWAVLKEDPVPPKRIEKRVPEALERVCLKAMQKRPSDRYPTARAFLEDLERFEEGRAVRATPPSRGYRLGRWARRRRVPLAWAGIALAVAIAVFVGVVMPRLKRDPSSLVAAADALMRDGEPAAASRVYARALRQEERSPPDPALFDAMTDAVLAGAWRYWGDEALEEARATLDQHRLAGVTAYGRQGWNRVEEVEWALATTMELEGDAREADLLFAAALKGWDTRRYRLTGISPGTTERSVSARIVRGIVPRIRTENAGMRAASIAQLRAIARHGFQGDTLVIGALEYAGDDVPRVLRTVIEAVVADKPSQVMSWHFSQQLVYAARRFASPKVEDALAELAMDSGAERPARHVGAALLADITDLPSFSGFLMPGTLARIEVEAEATVEMWQQLRAMEWRDERRDAWWDRLDLAATTLERLEAEVASRSQPSAHDVESRGAADAAVMALRKWFGGHAGCAIRGLGESPANWVERHRGEDPTALLSAALGLEAVPTAEDADALLGRFAKAKDNAPERAWIHHLLAWTLASPPRPPVWGLKWAGKDVLPRWRRIIHPTSGSGYWHTARYRFVDGHWGRVANGSHARRLSLAHPVTIETDGSPRRDARVSLSLSPPGMDRAHAAPRSRQVLTSRLVWTDEGLRIVVSEEVQVKSGAGWHLQSRRGGRRSNPDFTVSPSPRLNGWSANDASRNDLTLTVLLPERKHPDDDAWRAHLTKDLGRLADAAEAGQKEARSTGRGWSFPEAVHRDMHTISNLAAIACRIPLPLATPAMARLQRVLEASHPPLDQQADLLLLARLNGGDVALLEETDLCARLDRIRARLDSLLSGRELFWIRLLTTTKNDAIRELALERLETEEMSETAAGDLLDLVRRGVVEVTPAIQARLDVGPTEDRSFMGLLREAGGWAWAALVLWTLALVGFLRLLWPRQPAWARLVPAAWLIALGLAFVAFDLRLGGKDVVPDAVGLLLWFAGALVLRRETGPSPRSQLTLLAIAACLAVAADLGASSRGEVVMNLSVFLCVVLLPETATALRAPDAKRRRFFPDMPGGFALLYVLPITFAWVVGGLSVARGKPVHVELGPVIGLLWLLTAAGCILWAALAVIHGASVRKAWRRATHHD